MPHLRVRGIEIYYELHGSGPRLFFIGGSGGDLRDRPGVFDGPLGEKFEVLSFDQRGLGQSDAPEGPYTMADYGEDAAALLDALDFHPCLTVGVSFGGMVAQELVCRHPGRVSRLVLACTSAGGKAGASYPLHELEALPDRDRALRVLEISDSRYGASWKEAHLEAAAKMAELVEARMKPREDAARRGQRLQLEARSHHDTVARLAKVEQPTYICAGTYDGIAPPENQHALAKALPNATLEFFEGGHLFLIQDPSAFRKIEAFLAEEG